MNQIPPELASDYDYCRKITLNHYENFPVASFLLPKRVRVHVYPIYAFARHADDLADEYHDREGLLEWRDRLHRCVMPGTESGHPIFRALAHTIRAADLPLQLFDDLLTAFLMDLDKNRYNDLLELLHYCHFSANPVGRLILLLFGRREQELFRYSDAICTALQLTNFWQDVRVDAAKDRIYLPQKFLRKFKISENDIKEGRFTPAFAAMLQELIAFTRQTYYQGLPLLKNVSLRLKWELKLTLTGGLRILQKIEQMDGDVFSRRPALRKIDWLLILLHHPKFSG